MKKPFGVSPTTRVLFLIPENKRESPSKLEGVPERRGRMFVGRRSTVDLFLEGWWMKESIAAPTGVAKNKSEYQRQIHLQGGTHFYF